MTPLLTILAILPGLIIAYFIYQTDKFEKEAAIPLLVCFIGGMFMTIPAIYMERWGAELGWEESTNIGLVFLFAIFVVGFSEEIVKYVLLVSYPYPRRFFNEPIDGIIYAVMIGMGFATLENLLYADRYQNYETVIIRAFTAVPAHGVFAIISGYYVGKSKFFPERKWTYLLLGISMPILLHGLYDFFIIQPLFEWMSSFALLLLLFSGYWAWILIKKLQKQSPFAPDIIANENKEDALLSELFKDTEED